MASSRWSNLPTDILTTLSKILSTDVDILRLRSVCSSWRTSLPPRLRPSPFPLKVPSLSNWFPTSSRPGDYYLDYTTIYRLSPPKHGPCAGDSSDGWLFRVSEINPTCFAFLSPWVPDGIEAPGSIPRFLNLLNYRITEICKCYSISFVDANAVEKEMDEMGVKKICVMSNGCDFAVFVLFIDGKSSCWKYGQKEWSPMLIKGQEVIDMVVSNGKCYAISFEGGLFEFDFSLEPTEIHVANISPWSSEHVYYLLEYNSDLYVLHKTIDISMIEDGDEDEEEEEIPYRYEMLKKCDQSWERVCLPDEVIIYCEDASIILPVEDFKSYKGNCVHMAMSSVPCPGGKIARCGVFDLSEAETGYTKQVERTQFMAWPPPSWLSAD